MSTERADEEDFIIPIGFGMSTVGALGCCYSRIGSNEIVVVYVFLIFVVMTLGFEMFDVRSPIVDANACVTTDMTLFFKEALGGVV